MSKSARLLARAMELSKAGHKDDARGLFQAVLKENPRNESAWLYYADTFPTTAGPDTVPRSAFFILFILFLLSLGLIVAGTLYYLAVYNLLSFRHNQLLGEYEQLQAEHGRLIDFSIALMGERDRLRQANQQLETQFKSLTDEYHSLANEHNQLTNSYEQLTAEHQALVEQHRSLEEQHNSLANDYNALTGEYQNLKQAYDDQMSEYNSLLDLAITPPYIYIADRVVHIAFYRTDYSIKHWQVPFDALEADIRRGYENRDPQVDQASSKVLTSETESPIRITDYTRFIDSGLFRNVIPDLYESAGDDYAFIQEVWNIVNQLTSYSWEIEDTPRFPLETFLAGGGDCEDTTILFASMIKAAPVDWDVELIFMDGENPSDPDTMNHVIVYINTGAEEFYIETTGDVMQPYETIAGWRDPVN